MTVSAASPRAVLPAVALALLVPLLGMSAYVASPAHSAHDPAHALQQLDLLYLDEPAPGADQLGVEAGRVAVVLFCPASCRRPALSADTQLLVSSDTDLAARYGLGAGGRVGYAVIDRAGRVRYRTYDPRPDQHEREIQTVVDAVGAP